jgi:uncharacterized protein YyaL (SSP411 family)
MPNRLARETSPYLLQHADNPVDWYPWGEEALERARTEDKPVLLSIGYSACHWCHVMAHESFENPQTAALMNEHFINIKVDREERPDLDTVYMEAVQAMTGSGGWPLTVFVTPDGKPFYGGTYFPPEDRHGIPGFPKVLMAVADAYRSRRAEIEQTAKQAVASLTARIETGDLGQPLTEDTISEARRALDQLYDQRNGGFSGAPKFPQPMTLEFLLRYFHRTQDRTALEMATFTLEKMARGGIYDQIGGGFHRYSTDNRWLVPHFEKMLYDNALLSQVYLHAYLVTEKQLFRTIAEGTLDYILREMTSPEGGFYSAQDADTEGVEGKYYLWTGDELTRVVGKEQAQVLNKHFGVTAEGNFEGQNILYIPSEPDQATSALIGKVKGKLLEHRKQRVRPGRDEKILASWNGLMLASLAEAACVLRRQDYLSAAIANGSFLINSMMKNGQLMHSHKEGQARINGYLQDYAMVIEGLLVLHQSTMSSRWLEQAITLAEAMIDQFWDEEEGTFYDTGHKHEELFSRPKSTSEGALPSGPSAAVLALLKLARLTDNQHYEQLAVQSLRSMQAAMAAYPSHFSYWLCALDFHLSPTKEIALVGPKDSPATLELLHTLCSLWLPNKVVATLDPKGPPASEVKLLEDRHMINDQPTAYVCQNYACLEPVTEPAALLRQLKGE